jgi:hypothetical protein
MARIALALAALVLPLLPLPAQADPATPAPAAAAPAADTRELTRKHFTLDGKAMPDVRPRRERRGAGTAQTPPAQTPAIGTVRQWLGLDDTDGNYYRKSYTLRGVGRHIEVWVADDLAFPHGDCRTTPVRVTDAQVTGLITEFDGTIYPEETTAFSTPPDRDGADPVLSGDFTGAGDKTVTLVDNVRDANYFHFPASATYIAGFFSAQLNELFDRNVMTIDAYDWRHRTGANPPNDPTTDLCTSRPGRPRMYEGTFAHEWQHLLEYYVDPGEVTWVNEGLSDYAQTLVGYVDSTLTVYHQGFDAHLICFHGFGTVATPYNTNPRACGGPQNSLNLWNEGTATDVLADYGNAYQFMLYLHDRFGPAVLTRLHRDKADHGLAGVAAALPAGASLYRVIHDFQTNTLTDRIAGGLPWLRSTLNLANPAAYDTPGAAPNGADYVRLRDAAGHYLSGHDLRSVTFAGAATLPPAPLAWTVAGGALFSGDTNSLDAAAVTTVTIPTADPVLRFSSRYGAEDGYDYGYVTVSTDGGRTYLAVAGDRTRPGPLGPGLSGTTGGFLPHAYDLSAYAGKKVLIGFRYVTDSTIKMGGWSIKDITVGATTIASTPDGFRSPTQVRPAPVHAWSVRLVGMDAHRVREVPVDRWARLADFDRIVAIVSYDEPTEQLTQYAPYRLTVNGVTQPGGTS